MWRIFSVLLDALLPPHEDVAAARALSSEEVSSLLSPRPSGAAWITALLPYRNPGVRALIRAIKYHGETQALEGVGKALGEYTFEIISEKKLLSGWETPLFVPMPVSKSRAQKRGYNQAERIARSALPALTDAVQFAPNILIREERKSQVSVERRERAANVHGAFFVPNKKKVSGKCIVLVDDVVESGSTFTDARRALLEAGAKDVIGIALAH